MSDIDHQAGPGSTRQRLLADLAVLVVVLGCWPPRWSSACSPAMFMLDRCGFLDDDCSGPHPWSVAGFGLLALVLTLIPIVVTAVVLRLISAFWLVPVYGPVPLLSPMLTWAFQLLRRTDA